MNKRPPRKRNKIWQFPGLRADGGYLEVSTSMYAVLAVSGPEWQAFRVKSIRGNVRDALVRHDLIEAKVVMSEVFVRLTTFGMRIRDIIDGREARALNSQIWDGDRTDLQRKNTKSSYWRRRDPAHSDDA